MFLIPAEHITNIKKDERFFITKMGHGKASLCGSKVVLEVPSDGLRLGQRFIATGTNRLIPEDVARLLATLPKEPVTKKVVTVSKPSKRTFRKRK